MALILYKHIDQAFADLHLVHGGVREDYFGLLYLEKEHHVPREQALNQVAFGGNDYGIDGFHFDAKKRNLYLFQFKYTQAYNQFKGSMQRLIDDGVELIFTKPNQDDKKNQLLLQLRSCLVDNRAVIDQVCFRFVFTGDPQDAEHSKALDKLREDLEGKKYLVKEFFGNRDVGFVVEFRSAAGKVGVVSEPIANSVFRVSLTEPISADGPDGEKMYIGFMPLVDLLQMHKELGSHFFDRNIRYGLGESESVNRAISRALRQIVLDQSLDPSVFAFHHNGITLYAEKMEKAEGEWLLTTPRLLNGAQTITTAASFWGRDEVQSRTKGAHTAFNAIRVVCKVITHADHKFVTTVTVNNNRQNPVEPWNLHANDMIQLELQDKFIEDIGIYYERQDNAFNQLSTEDLEEYGIKEESKALQMLKLTQTFLLTDGQISRLAEMRRVFEDDKVYDQVFRPTRLRADSRKILLCYKVQFRLRKLANEISQMGQNKYWFMSRARYLLWALVCQGLLNEPQIENLCENFGNSMTMPADFSDRLSTLATTRARPLIAKLMEDKDYAAKAKEGNLSFLRTDRAFARCMEFAYTRWDWVHRKLP
ncbi:MAG: AIPR family protein [Chloroflexi bacterium]|nr:AIPR family protein [Chloroflexota bacterium]